MDLMKNYSLLSYKSIDKQLNDITFTNYFYRLMLLARSLFKWKNLPNGLDEKWIEKYLFSYGSCLFFKNNTFGYMVTDYSIKGSLNFYDEPTTVSPCATNLNQQISSETLENNEDCVIIRNNDDMIPTYPTIQMFAAKLTNIDRTIDTNIELQKIPYVITCSDKQKLSFKNAMNQRKANEPIIYADKNLDLNEIKVLKTDAPIVFDKLQIQKMNIWNECLTFLGINNANTDKRERLVTDEVEANNQLIKSNEDVMLKARQQACKLINEMYGLNISVERRTDLKIDSIEDFNNNDINIDMEEGVNNDPS